MQEEVTQKTIALVLRAEKLTADVLEKAVLAYLRNKKNQPGSHRAPTGKTTVRKLMQEGQGASTINVNEGNIKDFERIAKKYDVEFAIRKDKSQSPPQYTVFFKARDTDVIGAAFKEFVGKKDKKKDRPSVRRKLRELKPGIHHGNRHKERQKNRGRDGKEER